MDNAGENSSNVALWSNGSGTCKYTRNEITLRPFYHIVAKKICSQLHLLECTFLHLLCCSTVTIQRCISLRSSAQAELMVPRARTAIQERRPFSADGLTAWSGPPGALTLTPVAAS